MRQGVTREAALRVLGIIGFKAREGRKLERAVALAIVMLQALRAVLVGE